MKKIKRLALNSTAVEEDTIQKAIQISKILSHKEYDTSQASNIKNDSLLLEKPYFSSKESNEKPRSKKQGLHVGDELFTLGSKRFLTMLDLDSFTVRELADVLDVSLKIARRWINTAVELGIMKETETKFGEQAWKIDEQGLKNVIEKVEGGLNYLKEVIE